MGLEVLYVFIHQQLVPSNYQQILCILVFSRRREIETAGDQRLSIDYHNLVVSDGMFVVGHNWDTGIEEEGGC
jgi:hypothetical protein